MFYVFVISCILLIGCSGELSGKKETFEGQGVNYQFKLPNKWEKIDHFQQIFNKKAVFGAEDTNSNSTMFIMTYLKSTVELKDFASKTRLELQKRYGYKELDGVYLKEYKINNYKAIKYTLNTTYQQKDVWLHLYYIETKNGFVELTFYSANDGDYKKRSVIIDKSVDTIIETKSEKNNETVDSTETSKGDTLEIKNDKFSVTIDGVMTLVEEDGSKKLVLHYQLTNLSDDGLVPKEIQSYITATQKGVKLEPKSISNNSQDLDLKELAATSEKPVDIGKTIEGIWIFSIKDTSDVVLTFDQTHFPEEKPQTIYLPK